MKKILFSCLILFSSATFANNHSVIVKITNATETDCLLEKQIAINSAVSDPVSLPETIFIGQTMVFTMQSHDRHKRCSIFLTYVCGDSRTVAFFTDITPFQGMLVSEGYVIKSNKIHLDFSEEHNNTGSIADKSPIEIHWRLGR